MLNPFFVFNLSRGTKDQHRAALGQKMTRSSGLRDSGRRAVVDAHVLDRPGFLAAVSGNMGQAKQYKTKEGSVRSSVKSCKKKKSMTR